jgi:hypothetical protein
VGFGVGGGFGFVGHFAVVFVFGSVVVFSGKVVGFRLVMFEISVAQTESSLSRSYI